MDDILLLAYTKVYKEREVYLEISRKVVEKNQSLLADSS